MSGDSSVCSVCGGQLLTWKPHYCSTGVTKDISETIQELKESVENWKASDGFSNVTTLTPVVSDLELKIRKEVMARINKSLDIAMNGHCCDDIIEAMEDVRLMLNLLWGE